MNVGCDGAGGSDVSVGWGLSAEGVGASSSVRSMTSSEILLRCGRSAKTSSSSCLTFGDADGGSFGGTGVDADASAS